MSTLKKATPHLHLHLLLLLAITLSPILMILSAESPPPERFEQRTYATRDKSTIPPTTIDHTDRTLECFNLTTPRSYPIDVSDCEFAIDAIFHDPVGVMEMTQFSHNPTHVGIYKIPAHWAVGRCLVLLTSANEMAVDTFRLVDVILKAQKIIEQCPPNSKRNLGGLATIGHRNGFFVAVNGPVDDDDEWPMMTTVGRGNGTRLVVGGGRNLTGLVADPRLATIDELL